MSDNHKILRKGRRIACSCGWTAQFDTLRDAQRMGTMAISDHESAHHRDRLAQTETVTADVGPCWACEGRGSTVHTYDANCTKTLCEHGSPDPHWGLAGRGPDCPGPAKEPT